MVLTDSNGLLNAVKDLLIDGFWFDVSELFCNGFIKANEDAGGDEPIPRDHLDCCQARFNDGDVPCLLIGGLVIFDVGGNAPAKP